MQLGRYKHYKGGIYNVIAVAKHSETMEDMVVYHNYKSPAEYWVRPKFMFIESIEIEGKIISRFAKIADHE
jgi:hypothetical protein